MNSTERTNRDLETIKEANREKSKSPKKEGNKSEREELNKGDS